MNKKYCAKDFTLGDIIETKKQHPCGSNEWEITRMGVDFKIKCKKCDHVVMLPRDKFLKSVKNIKQSANDTLNN